MNKLQQEIMELKQVDIQLQDLLSNTKDNSQKNPNVPVPEKTQETQSPKKQSTTVDVVPEDKKENFTMEELQAMFPRKMQVSTVSSIKY